MFRLGPLITKMFIGFLYFPGHLGGVPIVLDDDIRNAVNRNASSSELEAIAVRHGMVTLQQDGEAKVKAGITTQEELNRSTAEL